MIPNNLRILYLPDSYLNELTSDELAYAHNELHNSMCRGKPNLKVAHDRLIIYMKNHTLKDELDEF